MPDKKIGIVTATLDLDNQPFEDALRESATKIKNFGKNVQKGSNRLMDMKASTVAAATAFSGYATAIYGAIQGLQGLASLGNEYVKSQRQLKNLTKETGDYAKVSKRVTELANKYGLGIGEVADQVVQLKVRTDELGFSNDQVLDVFEAVTKKGRELNQSNEQISGFMKQAAQSAGELTATWENLDSAQENSAVLFNELKEGMGKTTGEIRSMTEAGTLLGKDVAQGFLNMAKRSKEAEKAMGDAAKPIRTVEAAWQTLKNTIGIALGEMFEGSGGMDTLAKMIDALSEGLGKYLPIVLKEVSGFFNEIVNSIADTTDLSAVMNIFWEHIMSSIEDVWIILKGVVRLAVNVGKILFQIGKELLRAFGILPMDLKDTEKNVTMSFMDIVKKVTRILAHIPNFLAALFTGEFWVIIGEIFVNNFNQMWQDLMKLWYQGVKGLYIVIDQIPGIDMSDKIKDTTIEINKIKKAMGELKDEQDELGDRLIKQITMETDEAVDGVDEVTDGVKKLKKETSTPVAVKFFEEVQKIMEEAKKSTEDYAKQYNDLLIRNDPAKQHQSRLTEINNEYNKMIKKVNEYYKDNTGLEGKLAKMKVTNALLMERTENEKLEKLKEAIRLTDELKNVNKELNELKEQALTISRDLNESIKEFGMLEYQKELASIEKERISTFETLNKIFDEINDKELTFKELGEAFKQFTGKEYEGQKFSFEKTKLEIQEMANKLSLLEEQRVIQSVINELKMKGLESEEAEIIQIQKNLAIQLKLIDSLREKTDQQLEQKKINEKLALERQKELNQIEDAILDKADRDEAKRNEDKNKKEKKEYSILNAFKLKTDKQVHAQREQLQVQHFDRIMEAMRKHSKTSFAIFKALRLAQATISGLQAVVEAYRFGTEFGGVAVGSVFAATATAATALQISQIAAMQFEEKRFGGAVKGGKFYEVVERGNPEILSLGKRNILGIPSGMSGHVTPLNNLEKVSFGGGSKRVVINIINEAPNVQVKEESREETPEGEKITLRIQEIVAQSIIYGNNPIASALQTTYPLQRQGAL